MPLLSLDPSSPIAQIHQPDGRSGSPRAPTIYLLLLILASETLISEQSALSLSPAEFTRRFWIQRGNW
ncbi:hypothetical protein DTO164E3_3348 [Paecilomyces variotii]|nr:hypothetical protein DTO032I3_6363 [Paecilomyces variotii]KAJ9201910.1 hypothetical protein DTO164E3_3348 [Paecilomyces variotii]KAJ9225195.1 hypothetical protein DTO169C6_2536 [Paecilomyces variotii]KAJ9251890.1 hypothetical protein DTO207G8_5105 [Paecilomyces variotii]KAJ9263587.1 hypothetical protein DTO195F2_2847 [Paecilomyces variotii]